MEIEPRPLQRFSRVEAAFGTHPDAGASYFQKRRHDQFLGPLDRILAVADLRRIPSLLRDVILESPVGRLGFRGNEGEQVKATLLVGGLVKGFVELRMA